MRVDEESGKVEEVKQDDYSATVGAERGDEGGEKMQQQPKKQPYLFRRIQSAPVKIASSSSKLFSSEKGKRSSDSSQLLPLEKRHMLPPTEPKKDKGQLTSKLTPLQASKPPSIIDHHFPPLETCVVHDIELPGLNTAEFFQVFFADDAPYSMLSFQKKRGDVDIVYGRWEQCVVESNVDEDSEGALGDSGEKRENGCDNLYSLKKGDGVTTPLPHNSTRERTLKFNTLTKSYFGPAYARATKTQRATRLSNNVLVIEHVTQLADIPFSDRFHVIERWVVEAIRNDAIANNNGGEQLSQPRINDALYTCKLSVHAEVEMLKPCTWESQIRKKASETFTDVVTEWCRTATVALRATEEQKRKRLRRDAEDEGDISGSGGNDTTLSSTTELPPRMMPPPKRPVTPSAHQSELFAKHQRNFENLDNLIARGDLEWCSIEVMHSLHAGEQSAFAQVLEYPASLDNETADEDGEMMGGDGSRKTATTVIMRRKSQKLFKKLSSRVSKTKQLR